LLLLDLPHRDVGELLADDPDLGRRARVAASLPVGATALLAPLRRPKRVVVVGANYAEHVAEAGMAIPRAPPFFPIAVGTDLLVGPRSPIVLPAEAPAQVDYEAELAVVHRLPGSRCRRRRRLATHRGLHRGERRLGPGRPTPGDARRGRRRPGTDRAGQVVPDLQTARPGCRYLGRAGPIAGPGYHHRVNGVPRQQGRTSEMLFPVAELVAAVSARIPLSVGDVILTGTPAGVAASGEYLSAGDVVEVTVEGIGCLRNEVIMEGG